MSTLTHCPQCHRQLRIPDELLGKRIKCPTCFTNFTPEGVEPRAAPTLEVLSADAATADSAWSAVEAEQARIDHAWKSVQVPALCLLIVGALSLFQGLSMFIDGLQMLRDPKEHIARMKEALIAIGFGEMANNQEHMEANARLTGIVCVVLGPIGSLIGMLTVYAATRMRTLRSLRLARIMSVLSMLPFAWPCCLVGFPFGLWCLIVLGRPQVASMFE